MSHIPVLPCGSDSKPVHAQVVSQPHSLVVYSYIHTYVHIYMCAMSQQHPVVLWPYPFTHIPCPITISWWHGHTCSQVSCFPRLSVRGRGVHCELHPTQFQSMAPWHTWSHSCVPGSYHSIMCPWFTAELCPEAIIYRHGHTCSHKCRISVLSLFGMCMPINMSA